MPAVYWNAVSAFDICRPRSPHDGFAAAVRKAQSCFVNPAAAVDRVQRPSQVRDSQARFTFRISMKKSDFGKVSFFEAVLDLSRFNAVATPSISSFHVPEC
jgi:hypothetical protein